jgi:hypothetical protein
LKLDEYKRRKKMKALLLIATIIILLVASSGLAVAGGVGPNGPAPNSGDGVPDGSGMNMDEWPNGGAGPAPNAGDGVPDGSGF